MLEAQTEISELEQDIIDHRRPAEELNSVLERYLGHCDLRLEALDTGYSIRRGEEPATNLSEGERTTIAFLYFLQTLEDKDFNIAEGIVVIDDPISSLDSNCLFQTFAFMKERLKDAGQLFILTHNYSFFRQVKNWFKYINTRTKKNQPRRTASYMVKCAHAQEGRSSIITEIDDLLWEFESEYHYLFKYVHDAAFSTGIEGERLFQAPNAGRRLLEGFLAFKKPSNAGDLYLQLQSIEYDEVAKTRILRLCHTGSHNGQVQGAEDDFLMGAEIPGVLGDILTLIEAMDPDHYNEMIVLISPPLADISLAPSA